MVALFVVATIIVFLVIDYFVQRAEKRKAALAPVAQVSTKARFVIPKGYFFGKGHTWVELLSGGSTRVGLDDFVQKIMGKIDEVGFVPTNGKVAKGDKLFTIRQGDKVMSFRSPISGKIVAFNEEISRIPAILKKEPYKGGWVAIIEPANLDKEIKLLSIGNEAAQWLKDEIKRFRNFITAQATAFSRAGSPSPAGLTLMDGGIPVDGVMERSSRETWKTFEDDFLADREVGSKTNS